MVGAKRVLFIGLLTCLSLFGWAQGSVYFSVNGVVYPGGQCEVNPSEYGFGQPLRIGIAGTVPAGRDWQLYLTYSGPDSPSLRGVLLEYNGRSAVCGVGKLLLSRTELLQLADNRRVVFLHLAGLAMATRGSIRVHLHTKNPNVEVGHLTINLSGLRAPGDELAWRPSQLLSRVRSMVIPIYPNPVKSGSVYINLQGIPASKQGEVSVVDILGTPVYSTPFVGGTLVQCPADGLSKGVYFVRIDVEGALYRTERLVVDR